MAKRKKKPPRKIIVTVRGTEKAREWIQAMACEMGFVDAGGEPLTAQFCLWAMEEVQRTVPRLRHSGPNPDRVRLNQ